jgi:hypothetical protein
VCAQRFGEAELEGFVHDVEVHEREGGRLV